VVRSVDKAEGEQSDERFADGADGEGTPALAAEQAPRSQNAFETATR
jgi:hypothetical protein